MRRSASTRGRAERIGFPAPDPAVTVSPSWGMAAVTLRFVPVPVSTVRWMVARGPSDGAARACCDSQGNARPRAHPAHRKPTARRAPRPAQRRPRAIRARLAVLRPRGLFAARKSPRTRRPTRSARASVSLCRAARHRDRAAFARGGWARGLSPAKALARRHVGGLV